MQFSVLAREHQQEDKHNVLKYRNKTSSVDTGQPVLIVLMKKDEKNGVHSKIKNDMTENPSLLQPIGLCSRHF